MRLLCRLCLLMLLCRLRLLMLLWLVRFVLVISLLICWALAMAVAPKSKIESLR